jgi:hypothetical protein
MRTYEFIPMYPLFIICIGNELEELKEQREYLNDKIKKEQIRYISKEQIDKLDGFKSKKSDAVHKQTILSKIK